MLEEEIDPTMSEHLLVQTEAIADYTMTETRKELENIAIESNDES